MIKNKPLLIAIPALVLVLLVGSTPVLLAAVRPLLPASRASVTITPVSRLLKTWFAISAVTGRPDASLDQVQARLLSSRTFTASRTVQGAVLPDDYAHGTFTISGTTKEETLPAGTVFTASNGVQIVTDADVVIPAGQQVVVAASATSPGTRGNIGAFQVDTSYAWTLLTSNPNPLAFVLVSIACLFVLFLPCLIPDDWARVRNVTPFRGGKDVVVQQADLDAVTTPLLHSLTSDAQAEVERQVRPGEQLVAPLTCRAQITPPYPPDAPTPSLQVQVSVRCQGEVYDARGAQAMAGAWLLGEAHAQLGAPYLLRGAIVSTITGVTRRATDGTTVTVMVLVGGVWSFLLSDPEQFAVLIAGKTQAEATSLLLRQAGVSRVTITTTGGWGTALPGKAAQIDIVVTSVPGLSR